MIGYVELGTDSWIINITDTVLANKDVAPAGLHLDQRPDVHPALLRRADRPQDLAAGPALRQRACWGRSGLLLLGMPATNTTWLWLAAVTVYGIGKTFYWPTMLGVVSERFPRAVRMALGMQRRHRHDLGRPAGRPGHRLQAGLSRPRVTWNETASRPTAVQERRSRRPAAGLPKIAGLDNGKVGVLEDYREHPGEGEEGDCPSSRRTKQLKLEKDLDAS